MFYFYRNSLFQGLRPDFLPRPSRFIHTVHPVLLAGLCLFSAFLNGQEPGAPLRIVEVIERPASQDTEWRFLRYKGDMEAITRKFDRADRFEERMIPLVDMCGLYLRIVGDSRFARSEDLQGYRGRIAKRLQAAMRELKKQNEVLAAEKPDSMAKAEKSDPNMPEALFSRNFSTAVMDTHWQLAAGFCGGAGSFSFRSNGLHGSSGYFFRGSNAGEPFDNGPELVALIEAILHPDFWASGGGSGVLHYYRPFRVLVVRATTEVHEDLTMFLKALR
jgi:hypothetical protein